MSKESKKKIPQISVADFIKRSPAELDFKILAGDSGINERIIISERIQKLGLAIAGFSHYVHSGRVQIVGQSEIQYLEQLENSKKLEAIENLDFENICCILITKNLEPPPEFIKIANEKKVPVLKTPLVSSKIISLITTFLQEELAPKITLHGVLVEIYRIGVLILGDSGIGKSECALDLITRGHRLISDDSVVIRKIGKILEGESPELTAEHLEIRGLGILNIKDLFGISSVGDRKRVELCINFKKWNDVGEIERIGLEIDEEEILKIKIPKVILPVSSGRNLSTLVETAVRIHLLRRTGYNAAKNLIEKHTAMLNEN